MPLYFRQLQRWFPDLPIRDRGYMASEGCGSIPLTDAGCAGALAITTSFFEFIPVEARDQANPPVLTCAELQPNRDYYVLFTTSAGLYRYDINDVIRVVDFYHDVPLIEFVRKGRGMTSLTGEKLAEQQVTAAMLSGHRGPGLGRGDPPLLGRAGLRIAAALRLLPGAGRADRRRRSSSSSRRASTTPSARRTSSTRPSASRCGSAARS